MSMRALSNVYQFQVGWAPVAVTSTKTSSALNFANCIENLITVIPGLWTDGTSYTYSLTFSGTAGGAGTYTAVAAGDMVGSFTVVSSTATSQLPQSVSFIGAAQYVKVVCTVVGATTGAVSSVLAMVKYRNVAAAGP